MKTMKTPARLLTALALAACLGAFSPASATTVGRKIDKGLGNMQHALGWDTVNLAAVEKDASNRPTLERDTNAVNNIERKTDYYSNGNKKFQRLTVVSKAGGHLLTEKKDEWNDSGDLERSFVQDSEYSKGGKQTQGEMQEMSFTGNRLTAEVKKVYSGKKQDWKTVYTASISYYEGGDMKERVTEQPLLAKKSRETWAEKKEALGGRKLTTQEWNGSKGAWE